MGYARTQDHRCVMVESLYRKVDIAAENLDHIRGQYFWVVDSADSIVLG